MENLGSNGDSHWLGLLELRHGEHHDDHCEIWREERKTVFAGDVCEGQEPQRLHGARGYTTWGYWNLRNSGRIDTNIGPRRSIAQRFPVYAGWQVFIGLCQLLPTRHPL